MSAEYRVCECAEDNEKRIGLCEVVTDADGKTKCVAVASTEVFTSLHELKHALSKMLDACDLPVLVITGDERLSEGFAESVEITTRGRRFVSFSRLTQRSSRSWPA
jgi:hypothetical protein